ncbi:MAG: hypothetical protein ACREXS_11190 [Gammaproteobacteria bacterium]
MKILDVPQSGSLAGQTSSRNRYGQYRRTRASPVNPNSANQVAARGRLTNLAQLFRGLTEVQQAGWFNLGESMSRTDSLGQVYNLTALQAYVSVNSLHLAAGNARVDAAPALVAVAPLLTATITATVAAHSVAYTVTPLAAGARLFVFVSPQRSAGRSFESDYRLIAVSAAAAASPADIETAYEARFGVLVVGQRLFYKLQVYQGGFLSPALDTSAVVA